MRGPGSRLGRSRLGDTVACNAWGSRPVPGLAPAAKQGGVYVARVIRSNTLALRELPFVEAAKAIGMRQVRIAGRGFHFHYALAHFHKAWFHYGFSRFEEGIVEIKMAQQLDPLSPVFNWAADFYLMAGRHEDAIAEATRALAADPNLFNARLVLADTYSYQGRHEQAIAEYRKAIVIAPSPRSAAGTAPQTARCSRSRRGRRSRSARG